mmetsp:Transcript_109684/g.224131  ORF Transcript_109684/g.224131 Transcript_109684/m.224131 type:complete len:359 (+) Transcript_109684:94-1170(+)
MMQLFYLIVTAMTSVIVNALHARNDVIRRIREQGASDEWTSVSDVNVTFSYTFCCNETSEMENVLTSVEALGFCFTEVVLIIDVPHGGLKDGVVLPGGIGGYSEFLHSTWGKQMISTAKRTAQEAAALLESHCPLSLHGPQHPPKWRIDVMNYEDPAMQTTLESDFGVNVSGFWRDSMYPNTMVYDRLWNLPDTQYVWHSDAGGVVQRFGQFAGPNFVEASMNLMRSDSRVFMTVPTKNYGLNQWKCSTPFDKSKGNMEFEARWHEEENPFNIKTYINQGWFMSYEDPRAWTSSEVFFLDVRKFRSLLPFNASYASEPIEEILSRTFPENDAYQVSLDCRTNLAAYDDDPVNTQAGVA